MLITVNISKAFESEALNPTMEVVSTNKAVKNHKMGLYPQIIVDGLKSLSILKRCAELIENRLDSLDEKESIEGTKARYANLDKVRKKILVEYGDHLHELRNMPVGKMLISSSAFDFGDIDYYHLEDLLEFIRRKTREEDVSYWTERNEEGYSRSVLILCQLLFVLRQELIGLSHILQSTNPNHHETITISKI